MLNEISAVSGGNYIPSALELSGAGSLFFGSLGGVIGGVVSLMSPASGLSFQTSANALQMVLTQALPAPIAILMGIGLGSTVGALFGLGLYSVGFELLSEDAA
ncbi:MAG: hypothetical protein BGO43_13980 [Gammaproteobacteria bacterium 39-13]|nr:MAG: hypothetical protein BGO43_13980 [Gammaproteobacteria bacterium 39-13]